MGKQILTKIKDELRKMNQSTDVTYTKTYIPWNKGRGFSVECTRLDEDFKVYDEDGELLDDRSGEPVEFCVYYVVGGRDFDSCTMTGFLDKRDIDSLEEFVRMYR